MKTVFCQYCDSDDIDYVSDDHPEFYEENHNYHITALFACNKCGKSFTREWDEDENGEVIVDA